MLIGFEFGFESLAESDGFCGYNVHKRSALSPRENRLVDLLCVALAAKDKPAARSAKRFVRGGGYYVRVRHGTRVKSRRDETGDMRHIHHKYRARFVRDFAETLEVDDSRIRARARKNEFRLVFESKSANFVVVDSARKPVHAVRHDIEPIARNIDGRTVRKVPAVRKRHRKHGIPRF